MRFPLFLVLVLVIVIECSAHQIDHEQEQEHEHEHEGEVNLPPRETICDLECASYFSGPRTPPMAPHDLLTWSRQAGPNQRMRSRRS